jgi:hypothetical protein
LHKISNKKNRILKTFCENSLFLLQFASAFAHQPKNSSACSCNQTVFQSTRLFNHMYFIIARVAYACRVQSLRRPDAAEKGNNVALIVAHGVFEGSVAIAATAASG